MILTDEEIAGIGQELSAANNVSDLDFARNIESAILAKLAEGQEAVGGFTTDNDGRPQLYWEDWFNPRVGDELYLHPSAELAALQAEVERLHSKDDDCDEAWFKIDGLREQIAAAQAREQQLRDEISLIAKVADSPPIREMAKEVLTLPADRSALDAYLAKQKEYYEGVFQDGAKQIEKYKLDAERLDTIAAEYLTVEAFEMPTGGGDADVGWRVLQHHCGEIKPRVVSEVFKDDPRAAIDAIIAAAKEKKSGECKHCNGKGVSQISDPCICQFGQKGGAA